MPNETGNAVNISAETVPTFFGSKRPKIWLRRCQDEAGLLAIRTFILNRGKEGEAIALKNLRHALSQ